MTISNDSMSRIDFYIRDYGNACEYWGFRAPLSRHRRSEDWMNVLKTRRALYKVIREEFAKNDPVPTPPEG